MGLDSVGQAWIYHYRSACPSFEVLCGVRCAWGTWTIMLYGYTALCAFIQPRAGEAGPEPVEAVSPSLSPTARAARGVVQL